MNKSEKELYEKTMQRLESGELAELPCWSFIEELNSSSEEQLDSVAIRDGYRAYTYRQMFQHWQRYAEAFSGAKITGENHSRAALIGAPQTETIFAFYGLNMTGASISLIYHIDLYDEKQIYSMIEREKITDLVVSELYAFPRLMKRLLRDREMLGLRNIVLLPSPMGGEFGISPLEFMRNLNRELFQELDGGLVLEDLLEKYEACPISFGKGGAPIILHTTGTVSGMHKPVPLTDRAINSFVASAMKAKNTYPDFQDAPKKMVTCLPMYISWVYAMVDMLHTPLGLGMEIVCLPWGGTNPRYAEAIEHYKVNILFTSKSMLDSWLKMMPEMNLSKLKIVFMGGTYISPEFKKDFNSYLRSCGSTARVINGYGLSELGGACALCPTDREDDAIGFLLPGFKAKILVEDENRYYDLSDGPRTGVLLLNSPTMSSGKLDDTVFFELETIDGEDYFNSNDLMRVNEDGSLTCIGRSNHYFVNNAGVRFDAGLIETAVTAQPGITACGLAPEFHKILHDNVPVLYVEMKDAGAAGPSILRQALIQVFIREGVLADTNMPSQCVITETMPLNASGKVDSKRLASGTVTGDRYSVKPVRMGDQVVDILLIPASEGELATMGAGIPQELEGDPYNILSEVFAAIPEILEGKFTRLFHIPGLRDLVMKLTDFDIDNIPLSLGSQMPKMFTLAINKYLMPLMKGVPKMSKKKTPAFPMFPGMMPMVPMVPMMPMMPMPFAQTQPKGGEKSEKSESEDFAVNMMKAWKQSIEAQKAAMDSAKEQWNTFVENSMTMWDNLTDFVPDELPTLPGFVAPPMSPKKVVKQAKKFQEIAKEQVEKQADAAADFAIKSQEQAREAVATVMSDMKGQEKKDEEVKEVKEAEKAEKAAVAAEAPAAPAKAAAKK